MMKNTLIILFFPILSFSQGAVVDNAGNIIGYAKTSSVPDSANGYCTKYKMDTARGNIYTALATKQPVLVSGVNIKTINSVDITGAGNVAISGVTSTTVFLANDVVNNNAVANTLQDCTGLSFPVLANTTYRFKVFIVFNSIIATTGSRWSINGPATTFMFYRSNYTLTAASETVNSGITAYNNPSASNASSLTVGNIAIIEGIIRPSAVGTVIVRFASEISASAVTALGTGRSYIEFQAIN